MKKTRDKKVFGGFPFLRSRLFLVVLAWCMASGLTAGTAYGQSLRERITLKIKDATVTEALREANRLCGNRIVFMKEETDRERARVTLEVTDRPVAEVVKGILAGTSLGCTEREGRIVVMPRRQETVTVQGVVKDEKGQPLPGVTVLLKGTTVGTSTDMDGRYTMALPDNVGSIVLVYTFVGMEVQEIAYKGQAEIDVTMKEEVAEIDEVVVTGYFNKSKDSFTGSVTQVKREELRKFGNVNLIQALSMVDPSFKIKENNMMGSDPNTLPDFFVRGESSFMGGSNIPTFIVDGFEVSLQYVFDMDMDRIESISVLKDASATIMYGSRAANGVVVIETRRPAMGKFAVSYSNRTSLSIADLTDYDLMDAKEKLEFEQLAGLYYNENWSFEQQLEQARLLEGFKSNIARGVNTDWLAQPVRNAVSHSHSIYLEGGDGAVTYGLGGNYNKKAGVMKESFRESFGLNFDLTYRLKEKFILRNSFSYSQTNTQNSPYGSFSDYAKANPYNPIFEENGDFVRYYPKHNGAGSGDAQVQNPLYNASLPYKDETGSMTINNNLTVDYFITADLRFQGSLALTKGVNGSDKFVSPEHASFLIKEEGGKISTDRGRYTKGEGNSFSYNINATLNYNLAWGGHSVFMGAGINTRQTMNSTSSYIGTNFVDERFGELGFAGMFKSGTKPNATEQMDRMVGFFANVNYMYDNRYFADFSGRVDGSSKYGKDKRFAPLWSVGAGWNIANEDFLDVAAWLTRLTLRASIGMTGNQNFEPYIARTTLKYDMAKTYNGHLGAVFMGYGNKKLEWQRSLQRNIGLDLEILQRRLSLRLEYYNNRTEGLLLPVTVAPSLGFATYTENFGEQSNTGYEFDLNAVILRKKNFDLAVNFSGTHNENKIEKISNALRSMNEEANMDEENHTKPVAMYEEGESVNAIKVVRSLGINPANGNELFLTKKGEITEEWNWQDKVVVGCTEAKLEGNFGTNIIWKGFSLNLLFRYGFGGQVYNSTLAERVEGADPKQNADRRVLKERWQKPGDHTFYKNIADRSVSNATSRFVQDNNFLELTNLSVSYRLPSNLLKKVGFSNIRIGLNTSNLFYVSTVKRERGLAYPFAQEYTFSLNLNF